MNLCCISLYCVIKIHTIILQLTLRLIVFICVYCHLANHNPCDTSSCRLHIGVNKSIKVYPPVVSPNWKFITNIALKLLLWWRITYFPSNDTLFIISLSRVYDMSRRVRSVGGGGGGWGLEPPPPLNFVYVCDLYWIPPPPFFFLKPSVQSSLAAQSWKWYH